MLRENETLSRLRSRRGKIASWPVSRVLYGTGASTGTWQPFIWDGTRAPPLATHPNDWPRNRLWHRKRHPRRPYSVLLPVGFTVPVLLPVPRWALTPPFHPYPASSSPHRQENSRRGGLLSVALSLGSPPPDVIRHRVSVEPGLSSPYRLSALVKRGCPANWQGLLRRFGK